MYFNASIEIYREKRGFHFLLLTPLIIPLVFLASNLYQPRPMFPVPDGANLLVSKANPFRRIAGPTYFERISSTDPPQVLWKKMLSGLQRNKKMKFDDELAVMTSNYLDVREHRQESFKILGVPQMIMRYPAFNCHGTIAKEGVQVFLGTDQWGGSVLEMWFG